MDEEKDTKPKLDYEQVVEYIDERIIRIEQAAEKMEAESMKTKPEKKNAPCCLKQCWTNWCRRIKRCFCKD